MSVKIFDDTVGKVSKYIFLHDKVGNEFELYLKNTDICIYNPNRNYYENDKSHKYYNVWNGMHDNIINYSTIIENASEIYVVDSSFFCLLTYLKLKADIKFVKARGYNVRPYLPESEQSTWTCV